MAAGFEQPLAADQRHCIDVITERQLGRLPDIGDTDAILLAEEAQLRIGEGGAGMLQRLHESGQGRRPEAIVRVKHEEVALAAPGDA